MSSREPLVPGAVGVAAGQVGQRPAGFHEPGLGSGADRQVGEGLGDVAFADADRPVEDDGFAGLQPAQGGEVADLRGGQLRRGGEVESFHGGSCLEAGAAEPAVQGHGRAAGDLVLAQDLQEVQVAQFAGVGLGQAGVQRAEHAGQFQVAQPGGQRAAVSDGRGGHDVASLSGGRVHRVAGDRAGHGDDVRERGRPAQERRRSAVSGRGRWLRRLRCRRLGCP